MNRTALVLGLLLPAGAQAQNRISGQVVVEPTGRPAAGAEVALAGTGIEVRADEEGRFVFEDVEVGASVSVRVRLGPLAGEVAVAATPGTDVTLDPIRIGIAGAAHEHVTVHALGGRTSTFGAVTSFEGAQLVEGSPTLAELLEGAPGVSIRSLGPGPARPIIRGFDGDRVVILEDGVRTGDLSSQAAEHGMALDPARAERVEVMRAPASLLYSSSAVGGAVQIVSPVSESSAIDGFEGRASLGLTGADGGRHGSARFETGDGRWLAWSGGSVRRTSDYRSPLGTVSGSATEMRQGEAGLALHADHARLALSARMDDSRFGVPMAGMLHGAGDEGVSVDVETARRQLRADVGLRDLGPIADEARFVFHFSDFRQDEVETEGSGPPALETRHDNRSLVVRADVLRRGSRIESRVGFWGQLRDFGSAGPEALAPDVTHVAIAAFGLGEMRVADRLALLLGARLEQNAYHAGNRGSREDDDDEGPELEAPVAIDREFAGASASAGFSFDLGGDAAVALNGTFASRAPALEELYNFGLDAGVQAFEVGDPHLDEESIRGVDLSVRRDADAGSGSLTFFRYAIANATWGAARAGADGVALIETMQADAVYLGTELDARIRIGSATLRATASWVDAKFPGRSRFAPRIPPLHGRMRLDLPVAGMRFSPALRWALRMDRVHESETPTDGFAVWDATLSRLWIVGGAEHHVSLVARNLADSVYRRHTSVIKDVAAQAGRGVNVAWAIRFRR